MREIDGFAKENRTAEIQRGKKNRMNSYVGIIQIRSAVEGQTLLSARLRAPGQFYEK